MAKKKSDQHDNLTEIESALTKTEQFIEDNQKIILYVIGAIVLIAVAYLSISRLYLYPREKEAQSQMFMAEQYFEKDSFNLALNGDGNYLGFLDIIDDYGMTKAGKLAKYYAGISNLRLGNFDEAISYLEKFKTKDILLAPAAQGAIGDAYLEKGDQDNALKRYKKAALLSENELTAPIYLLKAGNLLENMDQFQDALEQYNFIKEKYPLSNEGTVVDKYISRVNSKIQGKK